MPPSEAPNEVHEPGESAETNRQSGMQGLGNTTPGPELRPDESSTGSEPEPGPRVVRGSRWLAYDTHELLQMISELEDERRWARLREGIWIAILIHLALLSALTWIPKYVFKVPEVVDRNDALKHKDFTYLDSPPELPHEAQPKVKISPVPVKPPVIDKQTLEALNRPTPPVPTPTPAPTPALPAPVQPAQPVPPTPEPQLEAPHPAAVPARPSFAMNSQNPADQLREAMRGSSRGSVQNGPSMGSGGLARHPGAGGGVEVLSDTQGVDFSNWLQRWHWETERTWDPLIPDEVNPPIMKTGQVMIRFKVLPNGRLMEGSMTLEGTSGDTALDRAAWGALTGSNYPPLPREFHGPYLELRALFMYNMEPQR